MALLLIPISLLGVLLTTSLLYGIAATAPSIHHDVYTRRPLSPIAGFYSTKWISGPEAKESVHISSLHRANTHLPIRVKLRWRSSSMSTAPDLKPSMSERNTETTVTTMKRFSVQLPPPLSSPSRTSSVESPKTISPRDTLERPDPNNFLVALAAQERRVLELKEELQKAETDLTKLKRQWAHHEATRKRQEIRQQAESKRMMGSHDKDISMVQEIRSANELARRTSTIVKTKQSQRKVFQGGRHTRALSLLSPTSLVNRGSVWGDDGSGTRKVTTASGPMTATPQFSAPMHGHVARPESSKEDIVTASKQIIGDIKEGLWTFIEDLRQATVGDEAVSASRSRQMDLGTELSAQAKVITLGSAPTPRKKCPARNTTAPPPKQPQAQIISPPLPLQTMDMSSPSSSPSSDDEGWDNWDSPPSKNKPSITEITSPTQHSTPSLR